MKVKMTKVEAVREFKETVLPIIINTHELVGRKDVGARREAWAFFTDGLCRDGRITNWQYMNWVTPKCCE